MQVEEIAIAELHQDPANARKHPDRNLSDIRASLARFGQQSPCVIDSKNIVRKGNGTMLAARELGWETLRCVRTDLSGVDATAYSIADNASGLSSAWDDQILAATLEAIRSEPDFPIESTGFTDAEIDKLLEGIGREMAGVGEGGGEVVEDPSAEWQGMPECENQDEQAFRSIHVHFRNEDDLKDFSNLIGQPIPEKQKWIWHPIYKLQHPSRNPYVEDQS